MQRSQNRNLATTPARRALGTSLAVRTVRCAADVALRPASGLYPNFNVSRVDRPGTSVSDSLVEVDELSHGTPRELALFHSWYLSKSRQQKATCNIPSFSSMPEKKMPTWFPGCVHDRPTEPGTPRKHRCLFCAKMKFTNLIFADVFEVKAQETQRQ
jgi:hypothetical protein